jgi:hypothetical protein
VFYLVETSSDLEQAKKCIEYPNALVRQLKKQSKEASSVFFLGEALSSLEQAKKRMED